MNWVTVIWSILIGACAAMALPSLFLGIRQGWPVDLFFGRVAVGILGLAVGELALMHATLPDQYGVVQMDLGPAIFLIVVREIPEATSKLLVFLSGTHTKRRT